MGTPPPRNIIDNQDFFVPIVQPDATPAKGWTLLLLACSAIAEIDCPSLLLVGPASNGAAAASSLARFAFRV